jgi:hypothetical protein
MEANLTDHKISAKSLHRSCARLATRHDGKPLSEMQTTQASVAKTMHSRLPGTVWALGFVSMFMDISSEMIHGLLPVFLVSALGASIATFGLSEGIGEATASIPKLFSGWIRD